MNLESECEHQQLNYMTCVVIHDPVKHTLRQRNALRGAYLDHEDPDTRGLHVYTTMVLPSEGVPYDFDLLQNSAI